MEIKLRIKDILKDKNISSKELATLLNKAPQYVSNIINGGKGASLSTLSEIAETLGVGMGDLFEPKDEAPREPDFMAFVKNGKENYSTSSIDEAIELLERIRDGKYKKTE